MTDSKRLANEIVSNCRTDLCMDLRFMTRPVLSVESVILDGDGPYSTDGIHLYFHEERVISDFRKNPNILSRVIAHMIMHLVLGHFNKNDDHFRDLVEDMIVEYSLDMLDTPHISLPNKDDRIFLFERMVKRTGAPTVDLLSAELAEVSEWQIRTYPQLFSMDDHSSRDDLDHPEWKEISAQMLVEVEGFSKNLSGRSEALMRVLRIHNRRHTDYRAFLRKFMTTRERVKVDVNEFDPAYYTFGLNMYGNIPLIDSLEHSNSPMIEDFVIAVDTSGSTMKGPVVKFIQDVYDIMEQCEISRRTNLHIVQCDDMVRSDSVVRSRSDMRDLLDNLEVKGGNGTDFRPVFQYVDRLIEEGQINDLKGLIYFTDGIGIYPTRKPGYNVAFLFCDDRYLERDTPVWAIKVMMDTNDLIG